MKPDPDVLVRNRADRLLDSHSKDEQEVSWGSQARYFKLLSGALLRIVVVFA